MSVSKILEASIRAQVPVGDESVQQGWVLTDGTILDLLEGDNLDHMGTVLVALREAGLPISEGPDRGLNRFMTETGLIRVCAFNHTMLHLAVVPTSEQVDACARIARYTLAEESGPGMEVYWGPAGSREGRLLLVKPLTAGRLRRTLEALPDVPRK